MAIYWRLLRFGISFGTMLLQAILLATATTISGRPESEAPRSLTGEETQGDPQIWTGLRSLIPQEFAEKAESLGLSTKGIFHNSVIEKLHNQVISDTQAIQARQRILDEYVSCSCPVCEKEKEDEKEGSKEKSKRGGILRQFPAAGSFDLPSPLNAFLHPQEAFLSFVTSCETKLVLDTIKLLRVSLFEAQLRSQQVTALVACNCPKAEKCRQLLDPLIYSIVTGQNETELEKAYWQRELDPDVFPQVLERGLADRLTNAAAAILTYFFQWNRPQHDAQVSPLQYSPPSSIFAPGADPAEWNQVPTKQSSCPHVQVNITNPKNGVVEVNNSTVSSDDTTS